MSTEPQTFVSSVLHRVVAVLAVAVAGVLFAQLALIWYARIPFPYDIEWMEGGMLGHAWRIQRGLSIYPEPSADFVPYLYPPGYATLLAWLGQIFGLNAPLGRVISLGGSLAAAMAIAVSAGRKNALAGLLGAALFLGCYRNSGAFYDLVRTDGLAIGLTAWAVILGLSERKLYRDLSAILLFLGFLVKQHIALFGIPLGIGIWMQFGVKDAARYAALSAVPALSAFGWLEWSTAGRFSQYVLGVPASHPVAFDRVFLESPVEWAVAVPAAVPLLWMAVRRPESVRVWTILGCGGVALFSAAMMRGHHGGFINTQIPGFWALSWLSALALAREERPLRRALGYGAVLLSLSWSLWKLDAETLKPTAEDRVNGDRVVAALKDVKGPILSPFAAWLPVQAGHEPSVHLIAIWDIEHHKHTPFPKFGKAFRRAVAAHHWGAVLDDRKTMKYGVEESYPTIERIRAKGFRTRVGWRVSPVLLRTPPEPQ